MFRTWTRGWHDADGPGDFRHDDDAKICRIRRNVRFGIVRHADILETAELFELFATMRLMLDGLGLDPWARGWHDAGDFGHDVDAMKF